MLAAACLVASTCIAGATTLTPAATEKPAKSQPHQSALRKTTLEPHNSAKGSPSPVPPVAEPSTSDQPAPVAKPAAPGTAAPAQKPGKAAPAQPVVRQRPAPAATTLAAHIDLTRQRMTVRAGGKTLYTWKISSGTRGHETPTGRFRPEWVARRWRSRTYDMAPMPYSVFFNGGIATHGTASVRHLGRPASHGCVRLKTANARKFYKLVRKHGLKHTRIVVTGKAKHPPVRRARRNRGRWARRSWRSTRRTYIYEPARRSFRMERNRGYRGYSFFAYPRGRY
jgi:lipoprotein-anchoring transpeptidase ErfK/SrfK